MISNDIAVALLYNCFVIRGVDLMITVDVTGGDSSGSARRRRRRRPPTASRLKGPRKQKSFAYKLLKRGLAKSFAYKLLKRGLANLMPPTSTSGVAPPLGDRSLIEYFTDPIDTTLRYEREELLKYGDLRSCTKKLALTVKLYSTTAEYDDEYLPVEHVTEGRGRERVRLLNAYVLRLRRDPPLQAYKVRRTDIVSGALTQNDISDSTETKDKESYSNENIPVEAPGSRGRSVSSLYALDRQQSAYGIPVGSLESVVSTPAPPPTRQHLRQLG
ncbi:hypothetical protein EVAR_39834_1 [Eumeta japonica]|uniref:Uncharacterized protein n=1 Tax=Eumeta variegata TaxID=151549 RepID=A0A4C1XBJ2_EUMVA|nr:hypothetical protein EVAR_39834_1 [Eumeta japonica]